MISFMALAAFHDELEKIAGKERVVPGLINFLGRAAGRAEGVAARATPRALEHLPASAVDTRMFVNAARREGQGLRSAQRRYVRSGGDPAHGPASRARAEAPRPTRAEAPRPMPRTRPIAPVPERLSGTKVSPLNKPAAPPPKPASNPGTPPPSPAPGQAQTVPTQGGAGLAAPPQQAASATMPLQPSAAPITTPSGIAVNDPRNLLGRSAPTPTAVSGVAPSATLPHQRLPPGVAAPPVATPGAPVSAPAAAAPAAVDGPATANNFLGRHFGVGPGHGGVIPWYQQLQGQQLTNVNRALMGAGGVGLGAAGLGTGLLLGGRKTVVEHR